jgi:hypothetical protein
MVVCAKWTPYPKVSIRHVNLESDKDHRNVGLDVLRNEGCDWLLIVDGDEVYTEATLNQVKALAKNCDRQGIKAAYFQSMTFVNDLQHFTLQEFPRLFKITPDCKFTDDNFMHWGLLGWSAPHVIKSPNIKYHHYSFCKGKERFETKKQWWESRFNKPFKYSWNIDADGSISDAGHKVYEYTGKHPENVERCFKSK